MDGRHPICPAHGHFVIPPSVPEPQSSGLEDLPVIADWNRERKAAFWSWDPPRSLLAAIRAYQAGSGMFGPLERAMAVVRFRFWSAVTGAEIPINTRIGGGLMIPHPNGIVVHPFVEIGPNCLLFQQVTLGATEKGFPQIGAHVDIGAGAKVIGPIHVGDHARIGANAVVTRDVPPGATVAGIPARILHRIDEVEDGRTAKIASARGL